MLPLRHDPTAHRGRRGVLTRANRNAYLSGFRPDPDRGGFACGRALSKAVFSRCARLPRTELAFADHPLVPVHLVLDPVPRSIVLAEQQTDDFVAAFGRLVDAPIGKKFHCLANAVFVFCHADPSRMEMAPLHQRGQCRLTEAARSPREQENARRQSAVRALRMRRPQ